METNNNTFNKKYYFLCGGFISAMLYCAAITFCNIPKENTRLADIILGVLLGSCIKEAYSFLFGTTSSSQAKDEAMASAQKNISDALAANPATPNLNIETKNN